MRVLLVKLTSMGDLIHALPALSDAKRAIPDIEFDWVIDKDFSEVATWHDSVSTIIPSAHRYWSKAWCHHFANGDLSAFLKKLRAQRYDLVLDAQNNLKSAVVTRLTRGPRVGLDRHSVNEWGAQFAYQIKYKVDPKKHAVRRMRELFAQALGYDCPDDAPNFAINRERCVKPDLNLPEQYLMFVHNASWVTKLWPETYWQQLIRIATQAGHTVLLPSGNQAERERAERLARGHDAVIALPHLRLSEIAYLLDHAEAAVCVDTGLSHLCAALDTPSVTIYGATDSGLIGATGQNQIHLQSAFACAPCNKKRCFYQGESQVKPACYAEITPEGVWQQLQVAKPRLEY